VDGQLGGACHPERTEHGGGHSATRDSQHPTSVELHHGKFFEQRHRRYLVIHVFSVKSRRQDDQETWGYTPFHLSLVIV